MTNLIKNFQMVLHWLELLKFQYILIACAFYLCVHIYYTYPIQEDGVPDKLM